MRLGVCYNLFDCEELLESSILSIRNVVDHVCVVYQKTSNYGEPCNPHLESFLDYLVKEGLIDNLIYYETKFDFTMAEREKIISKKARPEELGGSITQIGNQFLNECAKREIGRLDCLKNNCTHFLSMDADEYYFQDEMINVKESIVKNGWEFTVCRMRIYGKYPTIEYLQDDVNAVPFICICAKDKEFKLATPYPMNLNNIPVALDPTRRIDNVDYNTKYHVFTRDQIEMHHMTFLRKDITKKLTNVSNKANYGEDTQQFLDEWNNWTPDKGIIHPHPYMKKLFSKIKIVPNYFDIDFDAQCRVCCKTYQINRCGNCHKARYCSVECQEEDWINHKKECSK